MRVATIAWTSATVSAKRATRSALVRKRGSSARSGRSRPAQNLRQRLSLAMPISTGPSDRLEGLVGTEGFMAGAELLRHRALLPEDLRVVAEQRGGGLEQRYLKPAALAGAVPLQQRGEDAGVGVHAGRLVDRREGAADRPAAALPGHRHDAAEGLQDHVVAEPARPAARCGRSRRCCNRPAADWRRAAARRRCRGVRPRRSRSSRSPRRPGPPCAARRPGPRRFQVQRQAALVAVGAEEDGAFLAAARRAASRGCRRRHPAIRSSPPRRPCRPATGRRAGRREPSRSRGRGGRSVAASAALPKCWSEIHACPPPGFAARSYTSVP